MKEIDPKYGIEVIEGVPRIVKISNGVPVPNDEPLILFRGRDHLALPMLLAYRALCIEDGCNEYQLVGVDNRIAAFKDYKERRTDRMKQPGVTRGL